MNNPTGKQENNDEIAQLNAKVDTLIAAMTAMSQKIGENTPVQEADKKTEALSDSGVKQNKNSENSTNGEEKTQTPNPFTLPVQNKANTQAATHGADSFPTHFPQTTPPPTSPSQVSTPILGHTPTPAPFSVPVASKMPFVPAVPTEPALFPQQVLGHRGTPTLNSRQPLHDETKHQVESFIGRYVLSGFAALLVLAAAISLVVLVWDYITPQIKFVALSAGTAILAVSGAALRIKQKRLTAPAATVLGTGIAFGYVTILSANLYFGYLGVFSTSVILLGWTLIQLALAAYLKDVTTTVIVDIGVCLSLVLALNNKPLETTETNIVVTVFSYCYVGAIIILSTRINGLGKRLIVLMPPNIVIIIATISTYIRTNFQSQTTPLNDLIPVVIAILGLVIAITISKIQNTDECTALSVLTAGTTLLLIIFTTAIRYQTLTAMLLQTSTYFVITAVLIGINLLSKPTKATIGLIVTAVVFAWIGSTVIALRPSMYFQSAISLTVTSLSVTALALIPALTLTLTRHKTGIKGSALMGPATILIIVLFLPETPKIIQASIIATAFLICLALTYSLERELIAAENIALTTTLTAPALLKRHHSARMIALAATIFVGMRIGDALIKQAPNWDSYPITAITLSIGTVLGIQIALGIYGLQGGISGARPKYVGRPKNYVITTVTLATSTVLIVLTPLTFLANIGKNIPLEVSLPTTTILIGTTLATCWRLNEYERKEHCSVLVAALTLWTTITTIMIITNTEFGTPAASIGGLAVGAASILVGFSQNLKGLRIYGLAVMISMVLKLVTIDIAGQNSILRVALLIVGGIACFTVSAIYTRYEKNLTRTQQAHLHTPQ